jgi:predicted secreted protein
VKPASIVAIYLLFWVISAFAVLPFGVRTPDETGEDMVKGQATSAPSNFRPLRVVIRTTIVSAILFALFYANYLNNWISIEDIAPFKVPASVAEDGGKYAANTQP